MTAAFLHIIAMTFLIALTAFLASLLTLYSGFGLGTILTPVFGLFFPLPLALALTGVVHLLNNLFKITLLGKNADWPMVRRFGIPSVAGGALGAFLLTRLSDLPPLGSWQAYGKVFELSPLKITIAALMIFFACMEWIPKLKTMQFSPQHLAFGGLLSGFFGGLSGHQGALRSAFLVRCGLAKEVFIATGVVVACMVDFTRLPVYFTRFEAHNLLDQWSLLAITALCAFAGAWLGNRYLKKITLHTVQTITAVMIMVIAVLFASGIL